MMREGGRKIETVRMVVWVAEPKHLVARIICTIIHTSPIPCVENP